MLKHAEKTERLKLDKRCRQLVSESSAMRLRHIQACVLFTVKFGTLLLPLVCIATRCFSFLPFVFFLFIFYSLLIFICLKR